MVNHGNWRKESEDIRDKWQWNNGAVRSQRGSKDIDIWVLDGVSWKSRGSQRLGVWWEKVAEIRWQTRLFKDLKNGFPGKGGSKKEQSSFYFF